MNINQKGFVNIILATVVAIVLVAVGYFAFVKKDETTSWQTYTNTQYGFELKYPADWKLTNGGLSAYPYVELVSLYGNFADLSSFSVAVYNNSKDIPQASSPSKMATKENNGYFFAISYTPRYGQTWEELEKILSTFKFTDSVNTSAWKTYTNTQYGFEFQYPASWKRVADANTSDGAITVIYPVKYPAQDYSARIAVYQSNLATTKKDNPLFQNKSFSTVTVNNIFWTKIDMSGNTDIPLDSFEYLTEKDGKTYDVGGSADLTNQILSAFKFTN